MCTQRGLPGGNEEGGGGEGQRESLLKGDVKANKRNNRVDIEGEGDGGTAIRGKGKGRKGQKKPWKGGAKEHIRITG